MYLYCWLRSVMAVQNTEGRCFAGIVSMHFLITCHSFSIGITRTCIGNNTPHNIAMLLLVQQPVLMKTKTNLLTSAIAGVKRKRGCKASPDLYPIKRISWSQTFYTSYWHSAFKVFFSEFIWQQNPQTKKIYNHYIDACTHILKYII